MKQATELEEQIALFEYASYQKAPEWDLLFAIPNGGYRKIRTGIKLKKSGLRPGIPDMFLPVARLPHCGLFIELKSLKGTIQKNQKVWHEKLREQGYQVSVCYGCEDAIKTIKNYLNQSPKH